MRQSRSRDEQIIYKTIDRRKTYVRVPHHWVQNRGGQEDYLYTAIVAGGTTWQLQLYPRTCLTRWSTVDVNSDPKRYTARGPAYMYSTSPIRIAMVPSVPTQPAVA